MTDSLRALIIRLNRVTKILLEDLTPDDRRMRLEELHALMKLVKAA